MECVYGHFGLFSARSSVTGIPTRDEGGVGRIVDQDIIRVEEGGNGNGRMTGIGRGVIRPACLQNAN